MPAILDDNPASEPTTANPSHLFDCEVRQVTPHQLVLVFTGYESNRTERIRELCNVYDDLQDQLSTTPGVKEYLDARRKLAAHIEAADQRVQAAEQLVAEVERQHAVESNDLDTSDLAGRLGAAAKRLTKARRELTDAKQAREGLDSLLDGKRPAAEAAVKALADKLFRERQRELAERVNTALLALSATAGPELDALLCSLRASEGMMQVDRDQWTSDAAKAL